MPDRIKNPTQVVTEARGMARRFFAKRGNHSEVHLDEYDLMILLGVAVSRGMDLERAHWYVPQEPWKHV